MRKKLVNQFPDLYQVKVSLIWLHPLFLFNSLPVHRVSLSPNPCSVCVLGWGGGGGGERDGGRGNGRFL